ncbi:MAG: LacI family transcriptional regulator [Flavobacterium sp.]|nr:MAG: LacI family transcriptional regulator [Flavobacterium sp.]
MREKATLKQIAAELHLSISTVSKALNASPEISDETRKRVQEYATLRNYKPNVAGLNLKNRKTRTIGVIIPNILNPFFAKVFSGIEKAAEAKGYNVITCISNESLDKEKGALDMLSNGTIDGFILSLSEEAQKEHSFKHIKDIINEGIPVVMFDRVADEIDCDKVVVDDFESAVHATQHLIDTGCKRIALLSSIDNISVGKLRAKGYMEALAKNNLQPSTELILLTDSAEDFDPELQTLFENQKIDGVFAVDEHASVAAMKAGIKNGYKIPQELSLIGFADGVWSRRLTPSLSTVSQHGPEIGEAAANLMIERLESKDEDYKSKTVVINTELRQRESTKKLNGK